MGVSLEKRVERAKMTRDLAAAKLETLRLEQTYRALDTDHNRRKRRAPGIEFKGEDAQIAGATRLRSVAKARDTRRNYGGEKAAELQLGLNTVGTGPKIVVHLGDDEGNKAKAESWTRWFNGWFAKHSDGRGNRNLADQARIALNAVGREGDILVYFDDVGIIPRAEGTLWYWEADQLPNLAKKSWDDNKTGIADRLGEPGPVAQKDGLIVDEYDRVRGYIAAKAAGVHGKTEMKYDEVTILPADSCALLYNPWRINQRRGVSQTIEVANLYQDLERFAESMIQRSILQSYFAIKIKKTDSVVEARDRAADNDSGSVPDETTTETGTRYKNWEKLSMNAIEYMDKDEDAEAMQLSGDLPDAEQLIEFFQGQAGWAQGMSAMYSTGKADASYSAAMAENNLTWALFNWWQKWAERYYYDWVAERAFAWGMATGRIDPVETALWADSYSWHGWPKKRAINPLQEAAARKTDLAIGAATYEDFWGPEWRKKLKLLGEQIQFSRDNGLFVSTFAPKTGSAQ